MPAAIDLLSMILATAKIRGFTREQTAALQEVHDAMTCERCVLVRPARGSLAGMPDPVLAPLEESLSVVRAVALDLETLVRDYPDLPRELAERLMKDAGALRAIGGPIDPNKPAGG